MPGICPSCNRQATIESEFCPACGAPMNPDAHRIQEERKQRNQILLPMKWHKFLTRFSLPLGTLAALYNLIMSIRMMLSFDPSLYRPDALPFLKAIMAMDNAIGVLLIPCFVLAEVNLLKMRWSGVRFLLFLYLSQAVYGLAAMILTLFVAAGQPNSQAPMLVMELFTPIAGMVLMFILVGIYYRKRRCMFK